MGQLVLLLVYGQIVVILPLLLRNHMLKVQKKVYISRCIKSTVLFVETILGMVDN